MTLEEFSANLPKGIAGGMIRSQDDSWSVKLWRKYAGSPPGIEADDFLFILRGEPKESPQSVFQRALPVAQAVMKAITI